VPGFFEAESEREMAGEFAVSFCPSMDAVEPSAVSALTLARGWARLVGAVAAAAAADVVDPLDRVPALTLPETKAPFVGCVPFPIPVEDGLRLEEEDEPDGSAASSIIFLQSASLNESAGGVEGMCLKRVVNWSWVEDGDGDMGEDSVVGLLLGDCVVSWARTVDAKDGRFRCEVWVRFMSCLGGGDYIRKIEREEATYEIEETSP